MNNLPTGTVTFLFTDIEGSTKLAEEHPDTWESLRKRHDDIMQSAIEAHNGYVFQIIGDAFCAAFHTANDGFLAAMDTQRKLQNEDWGETPIKVRMGLHTGSAELHANDYRGYMTLARVQRVMSVAYGEQIILSNASAELIHNELPQEITLRDMKEHRLKGLLSYEHLWQVVVPDLRQDFPPLSSLNTIPNNLPAQLTSFIGREKEVEQIKQQLEKNHLVMLTGSGGVGKTRLSLQVAADLLDQFPNGVWFVELAPITDPDLIPQTILTAAEMQTQQGKTTLESLTDFLRDKKSLLVLDNCEHLIEACAKLADMLLTAAPNLKILASSREALGVKGEQVWHVPSLSIPDSKHLPSVEQLSQYEAVRLFIERALLVQPNFALTNENANAVAQICYRLDGIPLAIELAAARLRMLGPEQIASRLDDRFRLLTGGARTSLPRQQTLRALIDWSYSLLTESEKSLLQWLSVFAGGCTLEAVEQVCGDEKIHVDDILDLLTHLVDKSLVAVDLEHDNEPRYYLLETVRQYAREKLTEIGESEKVRDQHLIFFKSRIEKMESELLGPDQVARLDYLDDELGDVRAAIQWAKGSRQTEILLKLTGSLRWYWQRRGNASEGITYLQDAIAMTNAEIFPNDLAKALNSLGMLFYVKGDYASSISMFKRGIGLSRQQNNEEELACGLIWQCSTAMRLQKFDEARASANEGLELYKKLGQKWGQGIAHFFRGRIELESGELAVAGIHLQQSILDFQELGDLWGQALSLNSLGSLYLQMGKLELAQDKCEKSLTLRELMRDQWGINSCYLNLGDIARLQNLASREIYYYKKSYELSLEMGLKTDMARVANCLGFASIHSNDIQGARIHFSKSIKIYREINHTRGICECLAGFAGIAVIRGKMESATMLLGSTDTILKSNEIKMWRVDQTDFDTNLATTQEHIDKATFNAAWAEGQNMSLDQAVAYALEELHQKSFLSSSTFT